MIERLADQYGHKIRPEQGKKGFRMRCPAHHGEDDNCHVFESYHGRIAARCFSRGCEPSEILAAIKRDTGIPRLNPKGHSYQGTYKGASELIDVWRIDRDGCKSYPTPGSRDGVPVVLWGDEEAETVIVCEGEKAARAVQRAGWTAASYIGGALCSGKADYSRLRGRTIFVWPDNDSPGLKAGRDAANAAYLAGAKVFVLTPVGETGSGDDAADVDELSDTIPDLMASATQYHDDSPSEGPEKRVVTEGRTPSGLRYCLDQIGIKYRWNIRRRCIEFDDGKGWREENDRHSAAVRERLRKTFRSPGRNNPELRFGPAPFSDYLNAVVEDREVDPFEDWLQTLPEWDGLARLDGLLRSCFEMQDDQNPPELVSWAGRFLVMGAVWRTLYPGAKLDEMPVLVGGQGIGKTTLLRRLLPDDAHDWFADGLTLVARDREVAEMLAGRVIVEVSEMVGLRRADIDHLKTVLSRRDDGYFRSAYAHHPETQLRRCVIVGTTNRPECLPNDESGNRRFVAIELATGDPSLVNGYLDSNREQLWAEGLARCRAGQHPRLPDAYKSIQAENNETYRTGDDSLETIVREWLPNGPEEFAISECAVGILMVDSAAHLSQSEQNRLGNVLRHLGCDKRNRRRNGQQVRLWRNSQRLKLLQKG